MMMEIFLFVSFCAVCLYAWTHRGQKGANNSGGYCQCYSLRYFWWLWRDKCSVCDLKAFVPNCTFLGQTIISCVYLLLVSFAARYSLVDLSNITIGGHRYFARLSGQNLSFLLDGRLLLTPVVTFAVSMWTKNANGIVRKSSDPVSALRTKNLEIEKERRRSFPPGVSCSCFQASVLPKAVQVATWVVANTCIFTGIRGGLCVIAAVGVDALLGYPVLIRVIDWTAPKKEGKSFMRRQVVRFMSYFAGLWVEAFEEAKKAKRVTAQPRKKTAKPEQTASLLSEHRGCKVSIGGKLEDCGRPVPESESTICTSCKTRHYICKIHLSGWPEGTRFLCTECDFVQSHHSLSDYRGCNITVGKWPRKCGNPVPEGNAKVCPTCRMCYRVCETHMQDLGKSESAGWRCFGCEAEKAALSATVS